MVLFLTIQSTVGLAVLGIAIIRLISRAWTVHPTRDGGRRRLRSLPLAVGLAAYSAIKVVAPAFYALGRTRVPLIGSLTPGRRVEPDLERGYLSHPGPFRAGAGDVHCGPRQLFRAGLRLGAVRARSSRSLRPHSRRQRGDGRRCLGGEPGRRAAGGGGTTVYLIQALTPIGVGGIVYFAAARLLGVDESRMLVRRFRR